MNHRMLVLLVLLLCLCWFSLAGLGLGGGIPWTRELDASSPGSRAVRGWLVARLSASDLQLLSSQEQGCGLEEGKLKVPLIWSCEYVIQPRAGKTQQLSLTPENAQSVRLVLVQPGYFTVDRVAAGGEVIELDVYDNDQAARLVISGCAASDAGECVVKINR